MDFTILNSVVEGIGLGITLAILTGPVFFALLQTSIRHGFFSGISFAIGVLISDATLIGLSFFGALQLINQPKNNFIIGLIGGTILIMFGLFNIYQKQPLSPQNQQNELLKGAPHGNYFLIALKGFAINIINPFVIIFWIGVVSVESARYDFSPIHMSFLFVSTLLTVFGTDVLKALGARKITALLSPQTLLWVNRLAGVILMIAGISLIWKVVDQFLYP